MKTFEIVDERFVALPGTQIGQVACDVVLFMLKEVFNSSRLSSTFKTSTTLEFNGHKVVVRHTSDHRDIVEKYQMQVEINYLRGKLETANV